MKKWQGKSRGNLLGYRIFVFFIKTFGVRVAYGVLYFVAFYYFVFLWKSNRYIFYYFRKRQKFSYAKSIISVYQSYLIFGKTLIDKTAISVGLKNSFTYEFDGIEHLQNLFAEKKGGILISAHIGNFEIAEHFFSGIHPDCQMNIITTDAEISVIKNYLESQRTEKTNTKFIIVKEDLSHIFEINKALNNNELICFTGDRYFQDSKFLEEKLLGKTAKFPTGPFTIASRLGVPIIYVYVMKEKNLHYHLFARKAQTTQKRNPNELLKSYTQNLEEMLKKYPLQWFNYFDFWDEIS